MQLVPDIHVASIGTVLAQGMNSKKKHEVGNLALCRFLKLLCVLIYLHVWSMVLFSLVICHSYVWRNRIVQIENLAAVVHAIAKSCGAKTVVDVGSGQVCHLQQAAVQL